jgi:hypothetical protein
MSEVLRIAKWIEVFERAESRKLKSLSWVAIPTSFSSNGYQMLLDEFGDDAPAIYGAWCALVAYAASCTVRGTLATSKGTPVKVGHIARTVGFGSTVFQKLIDWAVQDSVAWLVPAQPHEMPGFTGVFECSEESPDVSGEIPVHTDRQDKTEHYITRQDKTRPDQGSSSVGQSSNGGEVAVAGLRVLLDHELLAVLSSEIEDLCRRLCRDLPFQVQAKTLGRLGRIAIASGVRSQLLELSRSIVSGNIRNPKRYWDAAVKQMLAEAGVDYQGSLANCEALAKEPMR